MAVSSGRSLMLLVGGLVALTQSHYPHHHPRYPHHHPTGYNRLSRAHTWSFSPVSSQASLPVNTRSFSQDPRKSIFKSSRPRLSVYGERFPSSAERCGDCAGAGGGQVCGSDGKTYRWDQWEVGEELMGVDCSGTPVSCSELPVWSTGTSGRSVRGPAVRTVPALTSACTLAGVSPGPAITVSQISTSTPCPDMTFPQVTVITTSSAVVARPALVVCLLAQSDPAVKPGEGERRTLNQAVLLIFFLFRADKCFAFVAEKPWRSGVRKYGK